MEEDNRVINDKNNAETKRESIEAAIAKAKELRALHAALMLQSSNNNSPAKMRSHNNNNTNNNSNGVIASPLSSSNHVLPYFSAQDYPVFTPNYEDDPLPWKDMAEGWGEHSFLSSNLFEGSFCSDYRANTTSARKGFDGHICPSEDRNSAVAAGGLLRSSSPIPNGYYSKSRRNSLGDANSSVSSSCNKCKPALIISSETVATNNNRKIAVVPLGDSSQPSLNRRGRGLGFSKLFPILKKKKKNNISSNNNNGKNEDVLSVVNDHDEVSIDALRNELMMANESRDLAQTEVAEMKSSLGELSRKLESLERYCEELKNALRQALPDEKLSSIPRRGKSIDSNDEEYPIPVSEEVMVEGFLQIVSEARLSMKQLCKALLGQIIDEGDHTNNHLNSLLQTHKLSLNSKHSNNKPLQYHLEAIVNQSLYQDFENCVFQRNGCSKVLNPSLERLNLFQSFVALRNLSWNEVLRKGTKYYSEEFSKFCDQKMSGVITTLGWTKPWAEHMLQAFFVAAKCVWLLHLLAFSFNPPLAILRVEENAVFEANYMEDIFGDRQRSHGPSRVKVMVMPGFYVMERVLKCKVLCRYKPVS